MITSRSNSPYHGAMALRSNPRRAATLAPMRGLIAAGVFLEACAHTHDPPRAPYYAYDPDPDRISPPAEIAPNEGEGRVARDAGLHGSDPVVPTACVPEKIASVETAWLACAVAASTPRTLPPPIES